MNAGRPVVTARMVMPPVMMMHAAIVPAIVLVSMPVLAPVSVLATVMVPVAMVMPVAIAVLPALVVVAVSLALAWPGPVLDRAAKTVACMMAAMIDLVNELLIESFSAGGLPLHCLRGVRCQHHEHPEQGDDKRIDLSPGHVSVSPVQRMRLFLSPLFKGTPPKWNSVGAETVCVYASRHREEPFP